MLHVMKIIFSDVKEAIECVSCNFGERKIFITRRKKR
jgi:hypothetical protein